MLTVVSWNIQKLSAWKVMARIGAGGQTVADLIAQTVSNTDADLLLLMEGTRTDNDMLFTATLDSLQAMQASSDDAYTWYGAISDTTGKSNPLPKSFTLPEVCDAPNWAPTFLNCYKQVGTEWTLLDNEFRQRETEVREALESLSILTPNQEAYGVYFRCDVDTLKEWPQVWYSTRAGVGVVFGTIGPRSSGPQGELGYQTSTCSFNGRSPCLVELVAGTRDAYASVPLLVFHAPFEGMAARIEANVLLPFVADTSDTSVVDAAVSIICGDFNVDRLKKSSSKMYGPLAAQGYQPGIAEASTLKARVVDKPGLTSLECRASAYDNILVKPAGGFARAGIYDSIAALATTGYASLGIQFVEDQAVWGAWDMFRTNVSDHLPAWATITVGAP